jgi:molecular chaperone GrpE
MTAQDQAAPEGTEPENPEYIDESELEALRAERDDFRDKFMRALADAENSRKRADRDRREAEQYGSTRLARDLLPVYDNLKRALAVVSDDFREQANALIEGVELTLRELTNVMTRHGVTPISPAVGDIFDPQQEQQWRGLD